MIYVYWSLGITLGLAGAYLIWVWFSMAAEVRAAPREPMDWCSKHGAIKKEHMIRFLDATYCPTCFHEKLKVAEHAGR